MVKELTTIVVEQSTKVNGIKIGNMDLEYTPTIMEKSMKETG